MAFRQRWQSIRMRYEHQYAPADTREVTVRRVVNIFERSAPGPPAAGDYDRQFQEDTWFDDGPGFPPENCPRDMNYPSDRYYDGNPDYGNFHRHSPPHHQEPHHQRPHYDGDDLRHQIRGRKNGRPGPYFNNRGRGNSHKYSQNAKGDWDRSSGKKKNQPPPKKNVSPEAEKGAANAPKAKPAAISTPPPSVPAEEPPQTSSSIKEKTCDAEPEKEEEVAPSSVEPEKTQNEELKARRSEAIKAKALEIEKHHRQDCETFGTVVKMLVSKEPTLENLIHSALNANLSEMRQHCLAALRHYVKELDEALESDNTT
ncbi:periphilin-1-like isoform X2 [Syngnathus acus]|uniref:periphilin-1-like isoform X2 n=1 Tax=Syngnathus acus TaxID=161584 RepID=UPI0018863FC0|nr:periphilin-1-like isoform X2 [Syngnathus acus]